MRDQHSGGTVRQVADQVPLSLARRLTERQWLALDAVLAAVLAVTFAVALARDLRASGPHGVDLVICCLAVAAASLPLAVRRLYPTAVLLAAVVGGSVLVGFGVVIATRLAPVFALDISLGFALYGAAATDRNRLPWWALAVCISAIVAGSLASPSGHIASTVVYTSGAMAVGWLAGENARSRRHYTQAVAEHERQRARAQLVEERTRIARELHDEVAHAMSVIAVRSGAARMLGDSQPGETTEALKIIERISRSSLAELRRLLTVLRAPDDARSDPSSPAPGLAELPALVDQIAAAGVAVDVSVEGEARSLPATEDLSAYRIAQEALTNVLRHSAATTATLRLRYLPEHLEIECLDPGAARRPAKNHGHANGGHGIAGMRERAALYGGELQAESIGSGFRVLARLPIAEDQ
jgi:signal transduction histidine kinase